MVKRSRSPENSFLNFPRSRLAFFKDLFDVAPVVQIQPIQRIGVVDHSFDLMLNQVDVSFRLPFLPCLQELFRLFYDNLFSGFIPAVVIVDFANKATGAQTVCGDAKRRVSFVQQRIQFLCGFSVCCRRTDPS